MKNYTLCLDLFAESFPTTVNRRRARNNHNRAKCPTCKIGKRYCTECDNHLTLENFAKDVRRADGGKQQYCNSCRKIKRKQYYERTVKEHSMKARTYKYGITEAQYMLLLTSQSNQCAICRTPFDESKRGKGSGKRPALDHDHATGKIRALLCSACNIGLGSFRDNLTLLSKAMVYLSKHK